jgi:protein-disulfide isomerase
LIAHEFAPDIVEFAPKPQEPSLSFTRRNLFKTAAVSALAAAGFSGSLLPRVISPAKADPAATAQTPAATAQAPATTTPPADPALLAELAKPGPAGDVVLGSDKAPVTIIEYASMTCPHCAHFSATTFPELKKRYIDTGKVRFIFREFPFDKLAAAAFMLARCADKEGGPERYMAVVETLFAKQDEWVVQDNPVVPLKNIAKQLGFSEQSFNACLTNQQVLNAIEDVRNRAVDKLGVNSTPTFFINGKKVVGDVPIETMAKEIDPYLKTG